jgi:hypothetical protein
VNRTRKERMALRSARNGWAFLCSSGTTRNS